MDFGIKPKDDHIPKRLQKVVEMESQPPIKSKKVKYFEDNFFKKRLMPKTQIPKQEPYMPDYSRNKSSKTEESAEIRVRFVKKFIELKLS
jgi:type IV secretory pathway TraG/TraD family ATPase VirD4